MRLKCHSSTGLALALALTAFPPAGRAGEISPTLRDRLRSAPSRHLVRVIVFRRPGVALRTGDRRLAVGARRSRALRAEAPLRRALAGRGVTRVRSLWAMDALAFSARPDTVRALAARADVARVEEDPLIAAQPAARAPAPEGAETIPWNLSRIRAPELWAEGVDGASVTVGVIDTGVDVSHPDLSGKVLPGGWRDVVNGLPSPYDDNGHGTHIAGIVCGGASSGTAIGVAPGAKLLVAKALDATNRFYFSWVVEAGQWMADPNGDGDASDAPAIVNCSWTFDGATVIDFRPVIQLWRSVGSWPVFAAGNRGPGAYTTGSPGTDPLAISVGMTGTTDFVADSSSRGPAPDLSPFNGALKPDLTAPGVSILSAQPGGAYALGTGTSMAAPHVAGALALLRQAYPGLTIDDAVLRITATALDLGIPGPDAAYGHGRLDAYAAVHMAPGYVPPALSGWARDGQGDPLPNATVDASGARTASGLDGSFLIPHVAAPTVSVTVDAPGFAPLTQAVATGSGSTFTLLPRLEAALSNGDMEDGAGWEPSHPTGLARTNAANRSPGGAWALEVAATGDGVGRYWRSEPVPVSSGGLVTLNATYAWRGAGDATGRTTALVWQDGSGQDLRTDYGTPFYPQTRGGPGDGEWRTVIQAFRALPPPGAAWVRLRLGATFPVGDVLSRLWYDDAAVDFDRAPGTGALTGVVRRDGAPVNGAIVGEHPFGTYFAPADTSGRYVLVVPAGQHSVSAWAPETGPSTAQSGEVGAGGTLEGMDFALEHVGNNAAPQGSHDASSTRDGDHAPPLGADTLDGTAWSSALGSGSPSAPVWWSVDLGAVRALRSVEVHWELEPLLARISVSNDGGAWTPVAQGAGGWWQDDAHTVSALRLDGLSARHVRVEDIGTNFMGRMGLWEVFVRVAPSTVPGDADGNATVDAADIVALLRAAGGLSGTVATFGNGDVAPAGGDGVIAMEDAVAAARMWVQSPE